jgi:hypothetical protein
MLDKHSLTANMKNLTFAVNLFGKAREYHSFKHNNESEEKGVWVADCARRPNPELYKLTHNSSNGSKLPNIKYEYLSHLCASGI